MSGPRDDRGVNSHSSLARFETAIAKNASLEEISTLVPPTVIFDDATVFQMLECALLVGAEYKVIQFLLKCGNSNVLLQRCNAQGCTLLHLACKSNASTQVIQLLLHGSPSAVRVASKQGMLPLHFACLYSSSSVVKQLVERNPTTIGAQDATGSLPIHYACRNKQSSLDIAKLLLHHQPKLVRQVDKEGRLPIHFACQTTSRKLVELLASLYPKSLELHEKSGCLPLHYVFERRHASLDILEFLLQNYPDGIHCADEHGNHPLHKACQKYPTNKQHVECIYRLVQADMYTVLHKTCEGDLPLDLLNRNIANKSNVILYMRMQQTKAVEEIRRACNHVLDTQLGMPDLVVAEIWSYVWRDAQN